MKALPARFSERRMQAKSDPEGLVYFTIKPMDNRVRAHMQGAHISYEETSECDSCKRPLYLTVVDHAGSRFDTVGFGLVSIENFTNADGMPFILEKKQVKLGSASVARVTDDCMLRFPAALFDEILGEVNIATTLTDEEVKDLKNTCDSSSPNSTIAPDATETRPDADTTA